MALKKRYLLLGNQLISFIAILSSQEYRNYELFHG